MQNALMILQLVPAIITLIKAFEEAIPGQGQGEAKLAAVKQILETVDGVSKAVWPSLENVIRILVATFNATGVFKKKAE